MADKLAVGLVSRTYFNMPLWIGLEHGFFAAEGIEIEAPILGNAPQGPPLIDGSLQLFIGGTEAIIQNAAEGGPLRMVGGNAGKLVHSLIARAPFKRIENLRSATIGILTLTEGTFFHLRTMLAAHGLHYPDDYKVTNTGGVPPRHKALLEGKIDAGLQSVPWNYVAEDEGMNNLGDVIKYVPDWQFVAINANRGWAANNRDLLARFLRAMLRGTAWLYANRAEASAIAARELPAPTAHAERAWDFFTGSDALTRDMSVNAKGIAKVIATLQEAELLAKDAPVDPAFYIDDSYLKAARAP